MTRLLASLIMLTSFHLYGQSSAIEKSNRPSADYKQLAKTHDLSLPNWGPYTKKYIGTSHIPTIKSGLRFDLSVFPGFYRQSISVPNVLFPSGYHPWKASSDLSFTEFRHELIWKDQVYADVSFSAIDSQRQLIRTRLVNNSKLPQNLVLHYLAYLDYPEVWPYRVSVPKNGFWKEAIDYQTLRFANPRPQDSLPYDGWINGEIRGDKFVNGSALAQGFGHQKNDEVRYSLAIAENYKNAVLVLRYWSEDDACRLQMTGPRDQVIDLPQRQGVQTKVVQLGALSAGQHQLTLRAIHNQGAVVLDGFALVEKRDVGTVQFTAGKKTFEPETRPGPIPNSLVLKYPNVDRWYGIVWDGDQSERRSFISDKVDMVMRENLKNHVDSVFYGEGPGHYTDIFIRPIPVEAESERIMYGMVCEGTQSEVTKFLQEYQTVDGDKVYHQQLSNAVAFPANQQGSAYRFSQERMAATLLTNVVYPVYTQKQYIKHNPPGRIWNSLYTWDSGFIGLGLAEFDFSRAVECLNTYTNATDEQAAFIHHGSPVPVQFYLLLELWNKSQSKELLQYFYPRLKRYHRFLAGHSQGSTTNALGSNLLKTWDYFYNSGGWDDYPAQVYVHQEGLEALVTPVINTAQAIRTAKILKMVAIALGVTKDTTAYNEDIAKFSIALQQHSWDSTSGYYSYVVHDDNANPSKIMRTTSGENFNKGMDGIYPLVAGICDTNQRTSLLNHLFSEDALLTPVGLSAVDQSASYFRDDGYWNGSVWMPHQWFMWKTMLDLGETDRAWQIAKIGLDVWQKEVDASYNCFEHFLIKTGRGAGWHHFGGLSTPVLSWFNAYFVPGRITVGFDGWVESKQFSENYSEAQAKISFLPNITTKQATVIVNMSPSSSYQVLWNGQAVAYDEVQEGSLSVYLPLGEARKGILSITSK